MTADSDPSPESSPSERPPERPSERPSERPRVLLIEDDPALAHLFVRTLHGSGYAVDAAWTGADGERLGAANRYDAVLLDLRLPDRDGLDVLRTLRRGGCDAPVVVLTGRGADEDVVQALDAGADDYVHKPVSLSVLAARLRALLRRGRATPDTRLSLGRLVLYRLSRRVVADGRELSLTPREFALLEYLLLHLGRVASRGELLERVWQAESGSESGSESGPGPSGLTTNVVDAHVARLRAKLRRAIEDPQIRTVRGVGFRLVLDRERSAFAPRSVAGHRNAAPIRE